MINRKNIVRASKRNPNWISNEVIQDKIIEEECKKRGFELIHFYAENGKTLNNLLI